MPRHKSGDFKVACVNHYRNISHSRDATCRALGCSSRSLARWIERYEAEADIARHNRQPRAYKMTEAQVEEAVDFLTDQQTVDRPWLSIINHMTRQEYEMLRCDFRFAHQTLRVPEEEKHLRISKTCSRLWNRDTNAASNIWKIAVSAIRGEERPDYLRRARGSISDATSAPHNHDLHREAKKCLNQAF